LWVFICCLAAQGAEAPRLDGRLDDSAWAAARLDVRLTQQSPSPGAPTPYETRVRVLVTPDALWFAFECRDPDPARIAIHTLHRDGDMEGDDSVAVVLDPYGDRRTGYLFRINADGARADGLISGPEQASLDWDGIWDARTQRSPEGWSAEIWIPSRTLNFTRGLSTWGLNLERFIARDRTVLRWASPTLDSFLPDLSRAGALDGVESLRQGRGLEFSPFAVGRFTNYFAPGSPVWQGQAGGDMTWRLTPQLAAVFTANTDFAETEVDSRQLNITRFPLFFPERRAFFLEGSNQYEFGLGLGTSFIPFFSRRVGLFQGRQIPIAGGFKLNGRAGRWNIGVLDVQTRETRWAPAVNLLASRVSYDVTRELRVGSIFTNGDPSGRGDNTLAGADAVWRTSRFRGGRNLLIGGWTAMTRRDGRSGDRKGWGYKVDYPNDRWDCYNTVWQFGAGLNPALGFLPRPGTRHYQAGCTFAPRPARDGPWAFVRQFRSRGYFTRVDNLQGFNESWQYRFTPGEIRFDSGDEFEISYLPQHEYLPAPFEIEDGVTLPVGSYTFHRIRVDAETSPHRPWRAGVDSSFGSFYNGRLLQEETYVEWTSPRGRWQAGLTVEQNFGRLDQGSFVQRLWQLNLNVAWSPNVSLTSFIQYDSDSANLGQNTRLRWTLKPGNDLFIVWNRGWRRLFLSPRERDEFSLIPDTELVAVKLRWTFRP
jgi:hypothetical protein